MSEEIRNQNIDVRQIIEPAKKMDAAEKAAEAAEIVEASIDSKPEVKVEAAEPETEAAAEMELEPESIPETVIETKDEPAFEREETPEAEMAAEAKEETVAEESEEAVAAAAVETIAEPVSEEEPARSELPAKRSNRVKFSVTPTLPYSIEEAINRLRINISFLGGDVKKIMIVSSEPNEGKSFVALNLWKQMAMAGEKSLLIDLDMRKSNMVPKYGMKREDGAELKGTSHFLSGTDSIEDMILHTDMENGDVLPNVDNIVNPSMLFESRKFTEMIKYAEKNYRYIFIDVPPLGLVSDGELIGSVCDGAVLCVRGGMTSRNIVRRSLRQLERAGCPVLGIVLNRVGGSGSGYYHKYYGKKYYYNDQYYSKG